MSIESTQQILSSDVDPHFIESVAINLAWEYDKLYEALIGDNALIDPYREDEFNKRRGDCAMQAMAHAAQRHDIPFEFRRIIKNGQHKILIKAGRVILIQEPILTYSDHPKASEYKRQLSDLYCYVRQLELDLGDQPLRIRDWSGSVLAVFLHGPYGLRFTRKHKSLGNFMLAVPDANYKNWVLRLDYQPVAMHGLRQEVTDKHLDRDTDSQPDNVIVTPKRKNLLDSAKETEHR